MFKRNKTGNITVSFSWIFMIIVGAIFILISYSIISTYQSIEKAKYDLEYKQALRDVFNNIGRTSGIEENSLVGTGELFKGKSVKLICNEYEPILQINDNYDTNNPFINLYPTGVVRINPSNLENVYLITENFKLPFKITNILAITSKKNLIIFDKNSKFALEIEKKFIKGSFHNLNYREEDFKLLNPEDLKQEIKEKGLYSIIYVTDYNTFRNNGYSFHLNNIKNFESYIVVLNNYQDFNSQISTGSIQYIDKNNKIYKYRYIDYDGSYSLPILSLFSTPNNFNCSLKKIHDRLEDMYLFYRLKSNYYVNISKTKQICSSTTPIDQQEALYEQLRTSLNSIYFYLKNTDYKNFHLDNLMSYVKDVDNSFEQLNMRGCPFVY